MLDNDKVVILLYTTVLNDIAFLFDSKVHILHIKTALMCKKKKPTEGAIIKWMLGSTIQDTNLDKARRVTVTTTQVQLGFIL